MKHILFIIILGIIFVVVPGTILAAVPTPTTSVTQKAEQQINNLKERIASQVAQMHLVEKRGIIGTVSDASETQLSVTDHLGNINLVDVDEFTKFSSPSAKQSFGISDITKGTTVGIVGLYNKDSRRLLARWVDVLKLPKIIWGGIVSIDSKNYTFTVTTNTSDTITVTTETITKTLSYTKATDIVRSGFSKMTTGERVMVVGFPDAKDPSLLVASRILLFPDLPVNPKIPMIKPQDIAPITPSTGSGKKLTPIVK